MAGQSYNLTCNGTSVTRYKWSKEGIGTLSETGRTLAFPSLDLSDAGQYICTITENQTARTTIHLASKI